MCDEAEELTVNEQAWLRFLRELCNGRVPGPDLRSVQLLRRVCVRQDGIKVGNGRGAARRRLP